MSLDDADRKRRRRGQSESEASVGPLALGASLSRETFSVAFERCFDRVYAYVSRRVADTATCERIVGAVLAANLDLLVGPRDDRHELRRLKASSDRRIGLESVRSLSAGAVAP